MRPKRKGGKLSKKTVAAIVAGVLATAIAAPAALSLVGPHALARVAHKYSRH